MRFLSSFLLWILATVALAVAVPATWAQHNVVDRNGYSELAAETAPAPEAVPDATPAPAVAGADVEGARLIALNMALNGQSRAETDKYLAENFELNDRGALLDEVYATVEG